MSLAARSLLAQGGPPLITDDPDTPGPRHWEINLSYFRQRTPGESLSEEPRIDLNYGVGRRIQLKLEAPWLSRREDGLTTVHGAGNTVAGVKYRFWGEEGRRIAWSVYPQYEFNTAHSSVEKGLVEQGHALFLPTEMTVELAHVELNVEVGRHFASGGRRQWLYGVATEASLVRHLELLGEVHGEKEDGATSELIVNGGGRFKATPRLTLMLAAGHAFHGPEDRPRLLVYAGLQLNLPDTFDFAPPPRARSR